MFNKMMGKFVVWMMVLEGWKSCVLFILKFYDNWGRKECCLSQCFIVFLLELESLEILFEVLENDEVFIVEVW